MTDARAVPLREARDASLFGGKASSLGDALRAGLPVPDGWALSSPLVDAIAAGDARAIAAMLALVQDEGPLAVRSSAVGEDSSQASFAGLHRTSLAVRGAAALVEAVVGVRASARSQAALAYREKLGLAGAPRMGVVVQRMIEPTCAGVLFTRDPVSGDDVAVIEAAWGLGEVVVQGLVIPERWRLARDGRVLQKDPGLKDLEIVRGAKGGTEERPVEVDRRTAFCLLDHHARALLDLAARLDAAYGEDAHDVEWAFASDRLFLLQRRPITRGVAS